MDVLSDILRTLQLKAEILFQGDLCGQTLYNEDNLDATFHVVAGGECWLHLPEKNSKPQKLCNQDLVFFPQNTFYVLSDSEIYQGLITEENFEKQGFSTLVCGQFKFQVPIVDPIIRSLPEVILLENQHHEFWLQRLLQLISYEEQTKQCGSELVTDLFSMSLLIYIIRTYLSQSEDKKLLGLLGALRDKRISQALNYIHQSPEKEWTVDILAKKVAMSRASFASHFQELLGVAPIQYLYQWRMQKSYYWLKTTEMSIEVIAEKCGYQSASAFSKAFKRYAGSSPSDLRHR